MRKLLLILSTVFIVSSCASSKPEPAAPGVGADGVALAENTEAVEGAETAEGEKLICKRERITGSHRYTKTCLTQEQTDKAKRDSRAYIERLKRTAQPGIPEGGG
jgi:hypothetical protein